MHNLGREPCIIIIILIKLEWIKIEFPASPEITGSVSDQLDGAVCARVKQPWRVCARGPRAGLHFSEICRLGTGQMGLAGAE